MNKSTRLVGRLGEEAAAVYLAGKGFRILTRNFSTRYGEIDLICEDKGVTVFIEVKTKTGGDFGSPEEMFTPIKYAKIRRMAEVFLRGQDVECRIDMVAVEVGGDNNITQIRHYVNVTGK